MAGISKECAQCKGTFQTTSIKAATWQHYCPNCHGARRETAAIRNSKKKQESKFDSLEKRMKEIEDKNVHMDMVISAEISNALSTLSNNELFESVRDNIEQTLAEKMRQIDEQNRLFREKIQKQLLTMNNKLVKIMQEMKKND